MGVISEEDKWRWGISYCIEKNMDVYQAVPRTDPAHGDSARCGKDRRGEIERASIMKVLVMDDEPMLRDIIGKMLSRIGYEVDFAKDGVEAIELYGRERKSGEPFDAVILGLTDKSGGMGGMETMAKLLGIDPDVKAIITTGFTGHSILTDYRQYGFQGAFAKPFTMDELSKVVGEVLESKLISD